MIIYLSSLPLNVLQAFHGRIPDAKLNVLQTYFYLDTPTVFADEHRSKIKSLVLDSGAFSLQSKFKGKAFEEESDRLFRKYKIYLSVTKDKYDFVINMDDRFDPAGFEHNLERLADLKAEGINAVPVIHDLKGSEVDYFIDHGYKMVAIGQCKGQHRDKLEVIGPVVDKLWAAGVKVHMLGVTMLDIIEHIPAYSCDSVSWSEYGFRGQVMYWNPKKKGIRKTDTLYFQKFQGNNPSSKGIPYFDYEYRNDFEVYIYEKLGLTYQDLLGIDKELNRKLINILYFLEQEERVTEIHRKKGWLLE